MPEDLQPEVRKTVHLVLRANTLSSKHPDLKPELEDLLAEIDRETELIRDDNLAKGQLVYAGEIQASRRKGDGYDYWRFDTDGLERPLVSDDPPEYWGSMFLSSDNFVSDTKRFPWMSIAVSEVADPF